MKRVAVLMAQGYEEGETLTIVDLLRRANIECHTFGFGEEFVDGMHHMEVKADKVFNDEIKDYDVLVEGNTDTDPISRTNIRNNWDLSALRASSVVQALQNIYGINPKRLTAAGRGEFNPVAGNDTAEGKARNRRTEIIITPKLDQFMDLIDQAPDNSSSGIVGDENTKE